METTKYEYSHENVGTRDDTRYELDWYFKQIMTGSEAMRCCKIILKRWYNETQNEEILWRWMNLTNDPALYEDWARSVDEMLEERESNADPDWTVPARWVEGARFKPCKCCENCKYKD
jgi:hypothetical protein